MTSGCKISSIPDVESHVWLESLDGSVIGKASVVWKSCRSVAWLWIHPAYFQQAFDAVKQSFGLEAVADLPPEPKKLKMADKINEVM